MISKEAYVWIWLPDQVEPVVAGRIEKDGDLYFFNYGQSYLNSSESLSIFSKELPLKAGVQTPLPGLKIAGCLRDAAPDAWGRRVIINKKLGRKGKDIDPADFDEITYLLESGSDRVGALDFQSSAKKYIARSGGDCSLDELMHAAEIIEAGDTLPPDLDLAINHGSSIGGARPKFLIEDQSYKYIAKFSSTSDTYNVIKAEYVAMAMAKKCGLNVADVRHTRSMNRDVLLIKRFDRIKTDKGWQRKALVSALTLLQLDESFARYASYQDLAEIIRKDFTAPTQTLKELYSRLVFNVLVGNTDDHARNHAAFIEKQSLVLTPAYDICPQLRTGGMANQAMSLQEGDRKSQLQSCINAAHVFLLSKSEAADTIENQLINILRNWKFVCDEVQLSEIDKRLLQDRQFLNPYIFEDLDIKHKSFLKLQKDFKII